jgi:NAD(P)-dependent dehydrogenase (short-subunit alcohol dehydrogenase family)
VSPLAASELLRAGLLAGLSAVVAEASEPDTPGAGVPEALAQLGAAVLTCQLASAWDEPGAVDARIEELAAAEVERALAELSSIDLLVVDGSSLFARARRAGGGSAGERRALLDCLDASWNVTGALASRAFLAPARPGRIVYVAPAPDAGAHAQAVRAGLENLARTLSIEWARHAVTTVAIAPAAGGPGAAGEVAALTAYLASPAGAYFSGCLLDLRAGARAETIQ